MTTPTLFDTSPLPTGPQTSDHLARTRKMVPPHNGTEASRAGSQAAAWNFGSQCHYVFSVIKAAGERGATNSEIVTGSGLPMNVVCGRTNELRDMEYIDLLPERRESDGCDSGIRHQVWCAAPAREPAGAR